MLIGDDESSLPKCLSMVNEIITVYQSDSILTDGGLHSVPYEPVTKLIQMPI